jgi:putative DNA methylase
MADTPRLIEQAFPLQQASLTSVHEKNVRHGHISTLHIWPARRPLAACRAALLATLLPDPGSSEARRELCRRIGGKVVEKTERKRLPGGRTVELIKEEVEGGVLAWIGTEPKAGGKKRIKAHRELVAQREEELQWFRDEIRKAYGGRAPRVLDPFAGGGAIPLEAMRLGCEATAADLNPVAWFILKCTLEYPQKLTGKTLPLPDFILEDEDFMAEFYQAHPHLVGKAKKTGQQLREDKQALPGFARPDSEQAPMADLAWQLRAWGRWVLQEARKELAAFYPTYADFEPLGISPVAYERQEMRLLPLKEDGRPDLEALNGEFSAEYLADKQKPRWVAKPTVAYLWARSVSCKNCRATVPLLKTRWLCKKSNKRVLLTMQVKGGASVPLAVSGNANGKRDACPTIVFGIDAAAPVPGGGAAQRREQDKRIGAGTMSRAGARCPCCSAIMTMEDIRLEGKAGRLGMLPTAVVTESQTTKAYRLPTAHEIKCAKQAEAELERVFSELPFGLPTEPTPAGGGSGAGRAFSVQNYGLMQWRDLFTSRQLLALGTLVRQVRRVALAQDNQLPKEWREAVAAFLTVLFDKTADYNSTVCTWDVTRELIRNTFARFAIPMTWDIAELATTNEVGGSFFAQLEWIARYIETALVSTQMSPNPTITRQSATQPQDGLFDAIVTDPPYYDAIPYSDCMDFFYVWIKRIVAGTELDTASVFAADTSPKWDDESQDGELIDDSSRHGGDAEKSKRAYEDGMARAFVACEKSLQPDGRLVIVFAHKHPDAWETLVSAIIRAGFIVNGSWPIQTEMGNRQRAMNSAALASSLWIVCKKRPATARPGWDNRVLEEMRTNITEKLRAFWDAGIRGPDFVWAATGPALEAYSKHPVVKRANDPGQVMTVNDFLVHVRRMVVDFVVGEVLSGNGTEQAAADRMDGPTAYYLLHRHDFGLEDATVGACILYATACGIPDRDLETAWDLIVSKGGGAAVVEMNTGDEGDNDDITATSSGGQMRLKTWSQRQSRNLGYDAPSGRPVPLIDRVHCLMQLWRAGDVHKVDDYLDNNGLRRHQLFRRLLQSLIELSERGSEERSLLESLSNHIGARGAVRDDKQERLNLEE